MNHYLLEGLSLIEEGSLLCGPEERLNDFSSAAALLTATGHIAANQQSVAINPSIAVARSVF